MLYRSLFRPNLRRLLLAACVAAPLLILLLNGCAADPYNWRATRTSEPLPAVVVEVAVDDLARTCGMPRKNLQGCALRDYVARVCTVYTGPSPQPWLLTHELAHCAGYSHQ